VANRSIRRGLDTALLQQIDTAYTFARWILGRAEDAEDLTADVIWHLVNAKTYTIDNVRTCLLREVRVAALGRLQNVTQTDTTPTFDDLVTPHRGMPNIGSRTTATRLAASETEKLRRALAALPRVLREVTLLRDTEGLPYRDIAAIVAIPPSAIMSRLWRARDALQGVLQGSGDVPSEHEQAPALIDAYVDSEVDITTAAAFVQHIAQCPDCARRLLSRSKLVQEVRSVTLCLAPEWLRGRIEQQLGSNRHPGAAPERSKDQRQLGTTASAPHSGRRESPY
jgi:RNA polymerase sigma-70 factor (ECF subfamily)